MNRWTSTWVALATTVTSACSCDSAERDVPERTSRSTPVSTATAVTSDPAKPVASVSALERRTAALEEAATLDAKLNIGSSCEVRPSHPWTLRILPTNQRRETLQRILSAFGEQAAWCRDDGWLELTSTTAKLRELYGTEIGFRCVAGMGNSSDSAAFFLDLKSSSPPASLRRWIRKTVANDDPKAALVEVGGKPCER